MLMNVSNLTMFFGLALVIFLVSAVRQGGSFLIADYIRYVVPFQDWKSRTAFVDVCFYAIGKLSAGALAALNIFVSVLIGHFGDRALAANFGPAHPAPLTGDMLALFYGAIFLVDDFVNYVTHYLSHKVPVLWELHKVHHSATFLSPITKYRQHPLDNQVSNIPSLVILGLMIAVMRYNYALTDAQAAVMLAGVSFFGVIITLDPFRHSHIPVSFGLLDRIVQSPNMHRLHHSTRPEHFNKNLAKRLSMWDWIFGTAMAAPVDEPLTFGLGNGDEDRDYDTIVKAHLVPLVKIWRRLTPGLGGQSAGTEPALEGGE